MKTEFKMMGAKELEKKLMRLPEKVSQRVTRQAVNRALTPIMRVAKRLVPKDTKLLARSIKKKVKSYKNSRIVVGMVGIDGGVIGTRKKGRKTIKSWPLKYAHLVELGHRIVRGGSLKKGSRNYKPDSARVVGHSPARPFLRPAFDMGKDSSIQTLKSQMAAGVIREAKRKA